MSSKISNPGQRLHGEEDERDLSKPKGTVESPNPIEAASLSFCSDSLRSNCARNYSLIRKDGCSSHERCFDSNFGPDTSHFQTDRSPSSGSEKQLPACACTRPGALRSSLCTWQHSPHSSCLCANKTCYLCDFDSRATTAIRSSICRLVLQDQRSAAQAGASALVASAAALILALPGRCHARHAFGAVFWDTAGRSYCSNR